MQRRDEARPDLPVAPAPKAPKKKGKAVKIAGIVVGGLIVLSAIGAALPAPEEAPAAAPVETPADTTDGHESTTVDEPAAPTEPTAPEIVEPEFTAGQENAIAAAESYVDTMPFSEVGAHRPTGVREVRSRPTPRSRSITSPWTGTSRRPSPPRAT